MATFKTKISLWVRCELFAYGTLPVPPHPRLSVHNIKKIIPYAKSKGKSGFPRLGYAVWKNIACNKLQLPMDLAWMYFVTFQMLDATNPEERLERDEMFAQCTSQQELDSCKSRLSVPMLKFVLFLYLQHFHKISLRSSLASGNVEWPMASQPPELDTRSSPARGKSLDEHSHMTFVLTNLKEMLDLLAEPDASSDSKEMCLSVDSVEALGFVIAGSVDGNRTEKALQEIAMMQQVYQKSGYSKVNVATSRSPRGWKLVISRTFPIRNLQSWLQSHIHQNPFGISACITSGRRLSWPLSGEYREAQTDSKHGRIATNATFVPPDQIKSNKIVIMSQVCKQTIARSSATLENASLKIHRCHYSYIYLLSSVRSVSIEKCRHSTIVLGAVETAIHVNQCEHVKVIAVCRRLSASGSTSCTFHVLTPNRPLVLSGNDHLTFAPYHTHYPRLEEHMADAGLQAKPNLWDNPLSIGPDQHPDSPIWEIMDPKDLYVFAVPFHMDGDTMDIVGGLPPAYQKALQDKDRQIMLWQKTVKEVGLVKDQRKSFQATVEATFHEWLARTGHKRELDALSFSGHTSRRK